MTTQTEITWTGDGVLWRNLTIRSINGKTEGILSDARMSWITDKSIDLSQYETTDEAIEAIIREDWEYYTELTAYGDEG